MPPRLCLCAYLRGNPATVDASPDDDATTWIYATHDATTTVNNNIIRNSISNSISNSIQQHPQQAQQLSQWICGLL
jgi:hypothetical protein